MYAKKNTKLIQTYMLVGYSISSILVADTCSGTLVLLLRASGQCTQLYLTGHLAYLTPTEPTCSLHCNYAERTLAAVSGRSTI